MAYDHELADRIRELIGDDPRLTEQKMFGGLGFMIGGNLAVAASSSGGILVRVAPAEGRELVRSGAAQPMEMRGRVMSGWLQVRAADVEDHAVLLAWVRRGVSYAATLAPKQR